MNRYKASLENMPPSGGGGCHQALLRVANFGVFAGYDPKQIHDDLRRHVHGSRRVSDREILQAIEKAMADRGRVVRYDFKNTKRIEQPPAFNGAKIRQRIIDQGAGHDEADIWDASPIKIDWPPEEDSFHLIRCLYQIDDLLFIGERHSPGIPNQTIRTAAAWNHYFIKGGKTYPHTIPNPLTGQQGLTGDGKPSLRADACVESFRYATVEFDNLSKQDQLSFWWAVNLPVVALIDSGNKSIHGWIRIDNIKTAEQWTEQVESRLFRQLLEPLGVDGACRNEARLSRLPGHKRDTGKMQRLLYLAPGGRRVSG